MHPIFILAILNPYSPGYLPNETKSNKRRLCNIEVITQDEVCIQPGNPRVVSLYAYYYLALNLVHKCTTSQKYKAYVCKPGHTRS